MNTTAVNHERARFTAAQLSYLLGEPRLVQDNPRAAFVVDDVLPPFRPRWSV